eukprot:8980330-Pyramimonas_sp.AAC.1
MQRAKEKRVRIVAFCLLSAGIFAGKAVAKKQIIDRSLSTIADYDYPELEQVFVCGFTDEEMKILIECCDDYARWTPSESPAPERRVVLSERPADSSGTRRVELRKADPTQRREGSAAQGSPEPDEQKRERKKRAIVTVIDRDGVQAI